MRITLLMGFAAVVLACCGEPRLPDDVTPQEVPDVGVESSTVTDLGGEALAPVAGTGASREHLIGTVVGTEEVGSQTIAAIQALAASSDPADRAFAGEHLLLLAIDLDHAAIQDFARTSTFTRAKPEFAAYALLVQAELTTDAVERSRLLQASDQRWPSERGANLARARLRYFQLAPGARVERVEFATPGGTLSIGQGRVLMFFSLLGCGPCRAGYAAIAEALQDSSELVRVVLCMDGTPGQVAGALGDSTFPHELVSPSDTSPALASEFGVDRYPIYYVLDDGVVVYQGNDPRVAIAKARVD